MTRGENPPVSQPTPPRKPGLLGGLEELFRFGVSGGLGTLAFVFLSWIFFKIGFEGTRLGDGIRWAVPYLLTSLITHWLHRRIAFRWPSPYWRSLRRTYVIYGCSLFATTFLHDQLIWGLEFGSVAAFVVSVALSGGWNYLLFRHWGFPEAQEPPHASSNRRG